MGGGGAPRPRRRGTRACPRPLSAAAGREGSGPGAPQDEMTRPRSSTILPYLAISRTILHDLVDLGEKQGAGWRETCSFAPSATTMARPTPWNSPSRSATRAPPEASRPVAPAAPVTRSPVASQCAPDRQTTPACAQSVRLPRVVSGFTRPGSCEWLYTPRKGAAGGGRRVRHVVLRADAVTAGPRGVGRLAACCRGVCRARRLPRGSRCGCGKACCARPLGLRPSGSRHPPACAAHKDGR
jgi:hypothetical protein